jgi:hypothetical protein
MTAVLANKYINMILNKRTRHMVGALKNLIALSLALGLLALCNGPAFAAKEPENQSAEEVIEGMVKFSGGLMSVQARDSRPEELMKEVGEKCSIKIVLYGEVFTDAPVNIQFHQVPVRQGIERILRTARIKNYLTHFGETDENRERIVQLDLIGKKGGQRELTSGSSPQLKKQLAEQIKAPTENPQPKVVPPQMGKDDAERMQQNFLNMMDQILEQKFEKGEEPDPTAILQLFNDMVPPEMRDKIPPEVLEQMEKLKE